MDYIILFEGIRLASYIVALVALFFFTLMGDQEGLTTFGPN
jgi:hypothetical protein